MLVFIISSNSSSPSDYVGLLVMKLNVLISLGVSFTDPCGSTKSSMTSPCSEVLTLLAIFILVKPFLPPLQMIQSRPQQIKVKTTMLTSITIITPSELCWISKQEN